MQAFDLILRNCGVPEVFGIEQNSIRFSVIYRSRNNFADCQAESGRFYGRKHA